MGQLVDGEWKTDWYAADAEGRFNRPKTRFRGRVSADGSTGFAAQGGRYHLYVSLACPWAHRTLILRRLKRLESTIGVSITDPHMGDEGWVFGDFPGALPDVVNGAHFLREIYLLADRRYSGRVTTPVLWDRETRTIVNNESRQIMRMLDTEFDAVGDASVTLLPAALAERIDELLDELYEPLNNGVYRAGFAVSQAAYESACRDVFAALDHWDEVLASRRYLCGDVLTEADVALYTTLVRFDLVYHQHFKCNLRRIVDYENLWGYLRELYQMPAFGGTTSFEHIKVHYYWSQQTVNPHRVVPLGPPLADFNAPHGRDRL